MSTAQDSPVSFYERCASVQRFFAFALVALALLSYGSLPSLNSGSHLQSVAIVASAAATSDSRQVLVPQQANEYRGRNSLAVIEHDADEQGRLAPDHDHTIIRRHRAVALFLSCKDCTIARSDLKPWRPARGPPMGPIA